MILTAIHRHSPLLTVYLPSAFIGTSSELHRNLIGTSIKVYQEKKDKFVQNTHKNMKEYISTTCSKQKQFFRSGATLPLCFRRQMLRKLSDAMHQYEKPLAEAL